MSVGPGRLDAIWLKRARGMPMDSRPSARAVRGWGRADNANQGGFRQVTVLMEESWPGLRSALDPHWRGGVFGEVLADAAITVGDPVGWQADV